MKVKKFLLLCSPGGRNRLKELERYGPELAPKPQKNKDARLHHHKFPRDPHRPSLIPTSTEFSRPITSRSRNSSGSASGGSSSSSSSYGRSTFYDLDGGRRVKESEASSDSPIPSSRASDEQSVLENLDNYDLSSFAKALEPNLGVGDRVVWVRETPQSNEAGFVRWIGEIDGEEIAGIEFDHKLNIGSGWFRSKKLFNCKEHHGGLVAVLGLILEEDFFQYSRQQATQQSYVVDPPRVPSYSVRAPTSIMPTIPFIQPPLREENTDRINGRDKGIQGHRNSCYLDATLFAMFSFTSVFDSILSTPCQCSNQSEEALAHDVQRILREEIVNPLRKQYFTPAKNVMNLRQKMHHLDVKLTSEEMDPQEFLEMLFSRVLHLEEFLSLSSGESDFFHQVLCKGDEEKIPTVQELFEESLREQNLKLKKVPSPVLILQMPRSGNRFKMFKGILPNLSIDITDLIEDIPRMCIICGALATDECPDCYGLFNTKEPRDESTGSRTPLGSRAFSTAFCRDCIQRVHSRPDRRNHLQRIVHIPYSFQTDLYFPRPTSTQGYPSTNGVSSTTPDFHTASSYFPPEKHGYGLPLSSPHHPSSPFYVPSYSANVTNGTPLFLTTFSKSIPRVTMDLFAVICIETSHFVSFVKCGQERLAPWAFFDSMADRTDNIDGSGQNIPQVKIILQMGKWLDHLEKTNSSVIPETLETVTPELKRLLSDPYICLYYSPQSSMYA